MLICHCATPAMGGSCKGCSRYRNYYEDEYEVRPLGLGRIEINPEPMDYDKLAKKIADLLKEDK